MAGGETIHTENRLKYAGERRAIGLGLRRRANRFSTK
jgi:hypothetical protein